jgi:hypothetical protein
MREVYVMFNFTLIRISIVNLQINLWGESLDLMTYAI